MKKGETKGQKIITFIFMILVSVSSICLFSYFLYEKTFRDIFLLGIVAFICTGCTEFSFIYSNINNDLNYDNGKHFFRFFIIDVLGLLSGCIFPLIPITGWVFPVIALALSLFSNSITGITAYTGFLAICIYLSNESIFSFVIFLIAGIVFILLFDHLGKDFKIGIPSLIAVLLYSAIIMTKVIFTSKGFPGYEELLIPGINIGISIILLLTILRLYCSIVVDKEKNRYIDINDQEFELLLKYKEKDEDIYYNAIHNAYFADKYARIRGMDPDLLKNAGYYHKIIMNECKEQHVTLEEICGKYKFPETAVNLLHEYAYKSGKYSQKETTAIYLIDSVVSSLMYVIDNKEDKKEKNIEYDKLAVAVIRRKINGGTLNNSELTMSDIADMEKMFTGEKLYYDFLRRK